jgi:mono/diheme cytochrome c family protein
MTIMCMNTENARTGQTIGMTRRSWLQWFPLLTFCVGTLLMTGCDKPDGQGGLPVPTAPQRTTDAAQLALGKDVYQQHCAHCHGAQAEGDARWRQRGPDGKFPPPPLNGSGHAWHHSTQVLMDVITQGSAPGTGNMPAWGDKLSQQEITAVIAWLQSLWPEPVYDAWYEMQQRGR